MVLVKVKGKDEEAPPIGKKFKELTLLAEKEGGGVKKAGKAGKAGKTGKAGKAETKKNKKNPF